MLYNNSHLHGNGQEPGLYTPLPQVINKKIRHNGLCLGAMVETGKCADRIITFWSSQSHVQSPTI